MSSWCTLGVGDIEVYRMDTSRYVWRRVGSIGGATFFLGANCVATSCQVGGTQADCIYLLLWSYDGIRLYSVRLDDLVSFWYLHVLLILMMIGRVHGIIYSG